jgi:hypothetical protein
MFSDELALFGAGIQPQPYFLAEDIRTSSSGSIIPTFIPAKYNFPVKYPNAYNVLMTNVPQMEIHHIYLPPNMRMVIGVNNGYIETIESHNKAVVLGVSGSNIATSLYQTGGKPLTTVVPTGNALNTGLGTDGRMVVTLIRVSLIEPIDMFVAKSVCIPVNPAPPFTSDDRKFEVCDNVVSKYCINNYTDPNCACYTEQADLDHMFINTANVYFIDLSYISNIPTNHDATMIILKLDDVEIFGGLCRHYRSEFMNTVVFEPSEFENNGVLMTESQYMDFITTKVVTTLNESNSLTNITALFKEVKIGLVFRSTHIYTATLSPTPKTFQARRVGNRIEITRTIVGNYSNVSIRAELTGKTDVFFSGSRTVSATVSEVSRAIEKSTNDITVRMNMSAACVGATCPKTTSYKTLDQRREQCHVQCIQILDISGTDLIARGKQTLECGNEIYDVEKKEVIGPTASQGDAAAADDDSWITLPNLMLIGIGVLFFVLFVTWLILRAVKKRKAK